MIEQAYASQMSITRRIPSQPAHPLRWEHEKPGKDRGGRSVEDGAERCRRRVRHNQYAKVHKGQHDADQIVRN